MTELHRTSDPRPCAAPRPARTPGCAPGAPAGDAGRWVRLWYWVSNDPRACAPSNESDARRIDWLRTSAFIAMHAGCLLVIVVGVSASALAVAASLYVVRMFFITGFYHRFFSHRSFRAGRIAHTVMALLGATAGQRGPLWWAAHHREHHLQSDSVHDPHSPAHRGRWRSHCGWFLERGCFAPRFERIGDWTRYPELRLIERIDWLAFIALGGACFALGEWLASARPALGTSGAQMLVWGFFVSTVALYHATYTINSLAHGWGRRRFETGDDSRNNLVLALLTLGEGWHNNHHHYPASARHGFYWWELDVTWLVLRTLAAVGLIRDLKPVPQRVLALGRRAPT